MAKKLISHKQDKREKKYVILLFHEPECIVGWNVLLKAAVELVPFFLLWLT